MKQVQVLPPEVIAKIAAGEVVERPASVVKELLENALDAGASQIEIYLKEAGKQFIHIKDNGRGIMPDDLDTIFLRHATSKINSQDDLFNLHSLGFRGEALYSIAAVSDIQLKSRYWDSDEGWEVHYRGGARLKKQPAATSSQGTDIKVTEIFFNTPARKKFLKSNVAEMNAVLSVVLPHAMLHPQVRFLLINNDKKMVDVLPTDSFSLRFAQLLNLDGKYLIEDEYHYQENDLRIRMVLGDINIQRKKRNLQYFFVNDRPVIHKNFEFQVNDIYRLIFPPQTFSAFAVFINVPPDTIDANIHPTKREVKIKDEQQIASKLRSFTEQMLMTKGSTKVVQSEDLRSDINEPKGIPSEKIIFGKAHNIESALIKEPESFYHSTVQANNSINDQRDFFQKIDSEPLQERFRRSRYIGQFIRKFLLFEVDVSLLFVDQHAAQERIMFERFKNQMCQSTIEVQALLSPMMLSLSPQESLVYETIDSMLNNVGFECTLVDDNTIAIQTHPVLIKNPEAAVRSILAHRVHERCDADALARRACKASIVTGDKLSPEQALHQRDELLACDDPFTCPHGRPTLIEVKESFLDKQFLRT